MSEPIAHPEEDHLHPHPRLEHQSAEDRLRLIGDLVRSFTQVLEPQQLIERITGLITHRFDFFYTTIMLCRRHHRQGRVDAAGGDRRLADPLESALAAGGWSDSRVGTDLTRVGSLVRTRRALDRQQ